jgi:hypothetical protein
MTARQIIPAVIALFAFVQFDCKKIDLTPRKKRNDPFKGITYLIPQGKHSCEQNGYNTVQYTEQKFEVLFDSTSIYKAIVPLDQYDINKLFGFSDNDADHHAFSARFGWRWDNDSLRLFGYVYNNGIISKAKITDINIGTLYQCSIGVTADKYVFTVNDKTVLMVRASKTLTGSGYKLYPYFGGKETAPHDIRIWIKEL